jgi:hypothetical protein
LHFFKNEEFVTFPYCTFPKMKNLFLLLWSVPFFKHWSKLIRISENDWLGVRLWEAICLDRMRIWRNEAGMLSLHLRLSWRQDNLGNT